MSSIRGDRLYLDDIVASADAIARYLAEFDRDRFLSDEVMRDAVLRRLIVIGEAASRVSGDLRARHPAVAWGSARLPKLRRSRILQSGMADRVGDGGL